MLKNLLTRKIFDDFLIKNLSDGKKLSILGAGSASHYTVEILKNFHQIEFEYIIDKKFKLSEGKLLYGINTCNFEEFISLGEKETSLVIICFGDRKTQDYYYNLLKSSGFNSIPQEFIYEINLPLQDNEVVGSIQKNIRMNWEQINIAYESLQDKKSQMIFKNILSTYYCRKYHRNVRSLASKVYFEHFVNKKLKKNIDQILFIGGDYDYILNYEKSNLNPIKLVTFEHDKICLDKITRKHVLNGSNKSYIFYS